MGILIVLIPLGLLLLILAIAAFIWAVRHDQFEDLEAEGARILFDEDFDAEARSKTSPRQEAGP